MSKKYSDDEYLWDDEYDDSFDDVDDEDDYPRKKKSSSASKKKTTATKSRAKASSTQKSSAAASKNGAKSKTSGKKTSGKKKASKRKKKRIALMVAVCLLEVVLLLAVGGGLYMMSLMNQIQNPAGSGGVDINFGAGGDVEVNELKSGVLESMEGYTTFAVFGLDTRDQAILDSTQSDVILLVSVNNDTGEINMASVYRDTYLKIDQNGKYAKVNAAYAYGGPVQAVQALNTNLDLRIDHYVTVNWYAVAKTIDLMGGVDINVDEELFYAKIPDGSGTWLNSYTEMTARALGFDITYIPGPGYQTLNGLQAVALCRIRQAGLLDYGRTDNQREVLAQVFEKAKTTNLATLIEVAHSVFPNVATDLELMEMIGLLENLGDYYLNQSVGFPSKRAGANMENSGINWGDCIIAKDLVTNVAELHSILYSNQDYVPSDTVLNISELIARTSGIYAN